MHILETTVALTAGRNDLIVDWRRIDRVAVRLIRDGAREAMVEVIEVKEKAMTMAMRSDNGKERGGQQL